MPYSLTWQIEPLPLELAYTWRISRNASDRKSNFLIRVTEGTTTGLGEIAPNIRYHETPELITEAFEKIKSGLPKETISITELVSWLQKQQLPNALDFGLRSAYQHLVSAKTNLSVPEMLGIPFVAEVATSFSIPIMPIEELGTFLADKQVQRFKYLKLKVNPENLLDTVRETARLTKARLLLDGNEAWQNPDELLAQLNELSGLGVELMEQPLPADKEAEYEYLKPRSPFPLLADESVTDQADMEKLTRQFHGINVKLMKARCYYNAVQLLQKARGNGMFTMLGCMVESSLGISSAMNLASLADYADLDGFMLLKDDPFKLVTEKDGLLKLA